MKRLKALIFGILVSAMVLELYLRFFYPFPTVVREGEIFLPANASKIIKLDTPGLSREITFSRNSIGLRGEDPPPDIQNYLSIITLGGSTTESHYQSDDRTWTHILGGKLKTTFRDVWINNAGIDGFSTYGQMILLDEHIVKVKPKIVVLIIGANDVGLRYIQKFDAKLFVDRKVSDEARLDRFFKSAIVTFVQNLRRAYLAKKSGLTHELGGFFEGERLFLSDLEKQKIIERQEQSISEFTNRVKWLVNIARENGIEPVLVTEPSLLGDVTDKTSGIDLGTLKYRGMNGAAYWAVLQLYHRVIKEVGGEKGVLVIDMSAKMPKDSLYFYDAHHYTDLGAEKFADLLHGELAPYLKKTYPEYIK